MDLDKIKQQYQGATLAELINSHMKTLYKEILPQVIRGTLIEFETDQIKRLEPYIDEYINNWQNPDVLGNDLAEIYEQAIADTRSFIELNNISLSDKRIFDVFHVTTLKLTQQAYHNPKLMELIKNPHSN
ncbi:MAG: hypothetical protein HKN08_02505 [Gammaproteobacteria bacterium]|nr:hypothetical protein [Gammaproteobacteria bacterium]